MEEVAYSLIGPDIVTAFPLLVTLAVFIFGGYINKSRDAEVSGEVDKLLDYLSDNKSDEISEERKVG